MPLTAPAAGLLADTTLTAMELTPLSTSATPDQCTTMALVDSDEFHGSCAW